MLNFIPLIYFIWSLKDAIAGEQWTMNNEEVQLRYSSQTELCA